MPGGLIEARRPHRLVNFRSLWDPLSDPLRGEHSELKVPGGGPRPGPPLPGSGSGCPQPSSGEPKLESEPNLKLRSC
jgi:hypothetical protein